MDYDSLVEAGAIMGSGGVIVMDETTCMVDLARFFVNFTQAESCGKCVPCQIGTKRMLEILTRITCGQGEMEDLDRLEKLAEVMGGRLELDETDGWTSFTLVLSAAVDLDERFPVKTEPA